MIFMGYIYISLYKYMTITGFSGITSLGKVEKWMVLGGSPQPVSKWDDPVISRFFYVSYPWEYISGIYKYISGI